MPSFRFPVLTSVEEANFKQWAVDNYDEQRRVDDLWHPVIKETWAKIAQEKKDQRKLEAFIILNDAWENARCAGVLDDFNHTCSDNFIDDIDDSLNELKELHPYVKAFSVRQV